MTFEEELKLLLDPCYLFYCANMIPDPWQQALLNSKSDRIILLTSRQVGKSTTCAVKAIVTALKQENSLILIFAPSQRQSGELFRKVKFFINLLAINTIEESQTTLRFKNNSRILSLPGTESTIRGFSAPDLIIIDEVSSIQDGFISAISPMLATGSESKLILISSPKGERGIFYEIWSDPKNNTIYEKIKVTAKECKRISPQFLEIEKKTLGEKMYEQEYNCSFLANTYSYFDSEIVNLMDSGNKEESESDLDWLQQWTF